jgi:hypothetical protein
VDSSPKQHLSESAISPLLVLGAQFTSSDKLFWWCAFVELAAQCNKFRRIHLMVSSCGVKRQAAAPLSNRPVASGALLVLITIFECSNFLHQILTKNRNQVKRVEFWTRLAFQCEFSHQGQMNHFPAKMNVAGTVWGACILTLSFAPLPTMHFVQVDPLC